MPQDNHGELSEALAVIADRVTSLARVPGEGRERQLRAEIRDWLIEMGWDAAQIFAGERVDLRLNDVLGLPAVYVETKDPSVGISKEEIDKAFNRGAELPGLRAIVLTDGFRWQVYRPGGRARPFFDADVRSADVDFSLLATTLDPDRYRAFDVAEAPIDIGGANARHLFVDRFSELTRHLGHTYQRLLNDVLTGILAIDIVERLFDDWLLFSYGVTFDNCVAVLTGLPPLVDGQASPGRRAQVLSAIIPHAHPGHIEELVYEIDASSRTRRAARARESFVAILDRSGALKLFAEQTALVVLARLLFCRIWQQSAARAELPDERDVGERLDREARTHVALRMYADARRELADLDRNLYGLSLYDWWIVEDTTREALHREAGQLLAAHEADLNAQLSLAWKTVYRFDLSQGTSDIFRDIYEGLLPPDERLRLGGFYTRDDLARFTLELGGYAGDGKLIDPSCGSGTFLVEALLIRRRELGSRRSRSARQALEILERDATDLRGIDLHPFAVILTQLNLLLNSIENVIRAAARGHLPAFAYEGDTLLDARAELEIQHDLLNTRVRNGRVQETIRRRLETDRVQSEEFEWIVGNPPWGGALRSGGPLVGSRYEGYATLRGKSDIYAAFMEWAARRLRVGGKFCFITQNRYLSREYGKSVQRLLTGQIVPGVIGEIIIDLGEIGGRVFFPNETNYPCITIARKLSAVDVPRGCEAYLVRLVPASGTRVLPSAAELFAGITIVLDKLDHTSETQTPITGGILVGSRSSLEYLATLTESDGRWSIPVPVPSSIATAAEFALGNICDVAQGATPGGSGDFDLKSLLVMPAEIARELELERQTIVPVIGGRDINDIELKRPLNVALYPYGRNGQLLDLGAGIDESNTADARRKLIRRIRSGRVTYPNAARFLIEHYSELRNRKFQSRVVDPSEWYKWHRPRDPQLMLRRPKIVVRRQILKRVAAVDTWGVLPLDSCWAVVPNDQQDGWRAFAERVQEETGSALDDVTLLRGLAVVITARLQSALREADTPLQGDFLSVRRRDLAKLRVDVAEVVAAAQMRATSTASQAQRSYR